MNKHHSEAFHRYEPLSTPKLPTSQLHLGDGVTQLNALPDADVEHLQCFNESFIGLCRFREMHFEDSRLQTDSTTAFKEVESKTPAKNASGNWGSLIRFRNLHRKP